ncbi:hypothetical protein B0T17DRAFT_505462 [Bombardia bombarda]|uniref:Pyrroloquinoline quinone-dependent pyranose dehydrogenase beta-propeller domain-containing protein n=1 Tax=Bombardia bombarda TaxID=252184 RepID=A0AA39X827_9PEZI|nr:hypothetical protein B0T17DRAFT_505462 [Bombardia bombarda]
MFGSIQRAATAASLLLGLIGSTQASTSYCYNGLKPSYVPPVIAPGYAAQLVVSGLIKPRGMVFDSTGALLVVQAGAGIIRIEFHKPGEDESRNCLEGLGSMTQVTNLVENKNLNHGIELSSDGKTLYASSNVEVFRWAYDPAAATATDQQTVIANMSSAGHITRTLLFSRKHPDILFVSQGSSANLDPKALDPSSGISQIRAFNMTSLTPGQVYSYPSDGVRLGWGLRNSVGVAEHPATGAIYSVENSADQIHRGGADIHQDNPGEELNDHGVFDPAALFAATPENQGPNHGYPHCLSLWSTDIPDVGSMTVGSRFVYDDMKGLGGDDATCGRDYVPPRLTFAAHTAPLDIKFTTAGDAAYVSFHGSWNRDRPAGYHLAVVSWNATSGEPIEPTDSTTAAVDVLTNIDNSVCPNACFRPAGLAIDGEGRVFMTSDSTGEVYVVQRVATGLWRGVD